MNKNLKKLILAALFLAIGFVLPFFTGQIKEIGNMLLPMHIPVFLCGLICGYPYGLAVGFLLPLTRSLIFGMPTIYPNAAAMALELATYGLCIGLLFWNSKKQNALALYRSLILSMLAGRAVWGVAQALMLGFTDSPFTFSAFLAGAFLNAIPGIVIQLVLIPAIITVLDRAGLLRLSKE